MILRISNGIPLKSITVTLDLHLYPMNCLISSVASSLEKRGPGLHHLCFRVDDIDAEMTRLTDLGYRFLSDAPTPGAHGTRVEKRLRALGYVD